MSGKFVNRFSGKAEKYAKYRPGYPSAILKILDEEIAFDASKIVADIGSGTGLLAKVFVDNGNRVFGVEPNDEMRSYGESFLSGSENFTSVKGTAEKTGLGDRSVDLVTAGQALHWFDREACRREFARILTGGDVLIVYNERDSHKKGAMEAYEKITGKHSTRSEVPDIDDDFLSQFFQTRYKKFTVPNEQRASHQYADVVLDRLVLQIEISRELVQISRADSDQLNYPRPIFSAPLSAEQKPEEAPQFRIVLQGKNILFSGEGIWNNG